MALPTTNAGGPAEAVPGAKAALVLLLAINLFNYIDRQVLSAVLPRIQLDGSIFDPADPALQFKSGLLTSAFLASYMLFSPLVGWLDGRGFRRWWILGLGVSLWSLASGFSGLATSFGLLLLLRCCVGIGEGAYGPVASAMLSDAYPAKQRGFIMALFNLAIPFGSALGFVLGGQIADATNDWRPAFWFTFSGLALGLWCFAKNELPRPAVDRSEAPSYFAVLKKLRTNRSFVLCCLGMTAITFVIGGIAATITTYVFNREARFQVTAERLKFLEQPPPEELRLPVPAEIAAKLAPLTDREVVPQPEFKKALQEVLNPGELAQHYESIATACATADSPTIGGISFKFGVILVVGGLVATIFGAWLGENLKAKIRGAYFFVTAIGALAAVPCYLAFLYAPLPLGWFCVFLTVVGLFLHTGPAFTLLANVVNSRLRATAFAINILVIHALGDVISPPIIGAIADASSMQLAYLMLAGVILLGFFLWLRGMPFLDDDTRAAEASETTP